MRKAIAIAAAQNIQGPRALKGEAMGLSFIMAAVVLSLLNLLIVGVSVVRPMITEW